MNDTLTLAKLHERVTAAERQYHAKLDELATVEPREFGRLQQEVGEARRVYSEAAAMLMQARRA